MTYIDTNVLVRIITGDDKKQAEQVIARIQGGGRNQFAILDAVLVELCFILEFHTYKMPRQVIAEALEMLIAVPQIYVTTITRGALKAYKAHPKLDYADCLLATIGGKKGVLTFDADLQKVLR